MESGSKLQSTQSLSLGKAASIKTLGGEFGNILQKVKLPDTFLSPLADAPPGLERGLISITEGSLFFPRRGRGYFRFFFFLTSLLEYNCFTMVY